jgi:hypothetical protein
MFFLAGCASTFETLETHKRLCRAQGKKLLYNDRTFEPLMCMTEDEFAALKQKRERLKREHEASQPSPASDLAAGMILQGFALRGGPLGSFQAPIPYRPYAPPPFVPTYQTVPSRSCSSIQSGSFTTLDCF